MLRPHPHREQHFRGPACSPGCYHPGVDLLFLTDRWPDRGGAGWHLRQVVAAAAEAGHRVTVAAGSAGPGKEAIPGLETVMVRGLGSAVATGARLGRLGNLLDAAEVVHVQNVMNPEALRRAVGTGRAVVTVQDHRVFCPGPGKTLPDGHPCTAALWEAPCRECLPEEGYRRRLLELTRQRLEALAEARVVLVLSRYMARELERTGLPGARVVPPWVEPGPPRRDSGTFFLAGGRLVAHKAPLDAWEAWEKSGRPLPLVVAGAGPLARRMEGAELQGWLGPEDLAARLRGARALLFPSRWQEPFGILGLEALAAGTPVIVADSGGTEDWSGSGCLHVPPGDTAAMAAALRRLADDPALALDLGEAGRRAVADRFSRKRLAPELEAAWAVAGGR